MTLCPEHRQQLIDQPEQALHTYRSLMSQGAKHHNQQDFRRASQCFESAKTIIALLLQQPSVQEGERLLQPTVGTYNEEPCGVGSGGHNVLRDDRDLAHPRAQVRADRRRCTHAQHSQARGLILCIMSAGWRGAFDARTRVWLLRRQHCTFCR